jgi:glycogen operon protein
MMLGGDELGRTQQGNNNAYCQDNEISWLNWELDDEQKKLLRFVQRLIALRRAHPVFRRRDFFQGRPLRGSDVKDIVWLTNEGKEMSDEEWEKHHARSLGVYLAGDGLTETDGRGKPLRDDNFLLLFNAHHDVVPFRMPNYGGRWVAMLDTSHQDGLAPGGTIDSGAEYALNGRSLALLMHAKAPD